VQWIGTFTIKSLSVYTFTHRFLESIISMFMIILRVVFEVERSFKH